VPWHHQLRAALRHAPCRGTANLELHYVTPGHRSALPYALRHRSHRSALPYLRTGSQRPPLGASLLTHWVTEVTARRFLTYALRHISHSPQERRGCYATNIDRLLRVFSLMGIRLSGTLPNNVRLHASAVPTFQRCLRLLIFRQSKYLQFHIYM
jgi:hypothetical protein